MVLVAFEWPSSSEIDPFIDEMEPGLSSRTSVEESEPMRRFVEAVPGPPSAGAEENRSGREGS